MQDAIIAGTPHAVSMMLDFVPIVGQLKAVVEGIVGKDLITGDKLPDWQRGLGILLAIIPEAKGIFAAGRDGLRVLAKGVAEADKTVDEAAKVYRIAKGASRLTAEEVTAAEKGITKSAEFRKVAGAVEEMEGGARAAEHAKPPVPAAAPAAPLPFRLSSLGKGIKIAGEHHLLTLKRIGRQIRIWMCSGACGELIAKAEAMLAKLPAKHAARSELQAFINEAGHSTWIDDLPDPSVAQEILDDLGKKLEAIEGRHPGVVDADIAVPAEPEPVPAQAHEPDPHVEPVAAEPRVDPADLDPPGTVYKQPKARLTPKEAATDAPSWVKDEHYKPPRLGEDGEALTAQPLVLDHKYGRGNWKRGPTSEHNQIQKWADRHFE